MNLTTAKEATMTNPKCYVKIPKVCISTFPCLDFSSTTTAKENSMEYPNKNNLIELFREADQLSDLVGELDVTLQELKSILCNIRDTECTNWLEPDVMEKRINNLKVYARANIQGILQQVKIIKKKTVTVDSILKH